MKKKTRKLVLARETVRSLSAVRGADGEEDNLCPNDPSVYWSCVCTGSGMYTCAC
jgi:hypothetical protein